VGRLCVREKSKQLLFSHTFSFINCCDLTATKLRYLLNHFRVFPYPLILHPSAHLIRFQCFKTVVYLVRLKVNSSSGPSRSPNNSKSNFKNRLYAGENRNSKIVIFLLFFFRSKKTSSKGANKENYVLKLVPGGD